MSEQATAEASASNEARKWATICHLAALVGLLGNGIGFLIGPLAVWLMKRHDDPFIDEQGKEAVNFQLTMFIGVFIGFLLVFVLIGIPLLILMAIVMIVFPIIAAIKANDGVRYRYPMTIRFLK